MVIIQAFLYYSKFERGASGCDLQRAAGTNGMTRGPDFDPSRAGL